MFFNHRKTCAALQPPPGLGPADIATQSMFNQNDQP